MVSVSIHDILHSSTQHIYLDSDLKLRIINSDTDLITDNPSSLFVSLGSSDSDHSLISVACDGINFRFEDNGPSGYMFYYQNFPVGSIIEITFSSQPTSYLFLGAYIGGSRINHLFFWDGTPPIPPPPPVPPAIEYLKGFFQLSEKAKNLIAINTSNNKKIDIEFSNESGLLLERLPCNMLACDRKVETRKGFWPLETEAKGHKITASIYSRSAEGITEDVDIVFILKP